MGVFPRSIGRKTVISLEFLPELPSGIEVGVAPLEITSSRIELLIVFVSFDGSSLGETYSSGSYATNPFPSNMSNGLAAETGVKTQPSSNTDASKKDSILRIEFPPDNFGIKKPLR